METKIHKKVIFSYSTVMLIIEINFVLKLKQNWEILLKYANLPNFDTPFWIINDLQFFSQNYTTTTRTKNKIFWNFYKNPIIFKPDFVVRVRSLMFSRMTLSVSNDVIFFDKAIEDIPLTLNVKFHWNCFFRSRDHI